MKFFFLSILSLLLVSCHATPLKESVIHTQATGTDRILLDHSARGVLMQKLLSTQCDQTLFGVPDTSPPTQTIHYQNAQAGFAVDVPFNPAWGSEKYAATPYDENMSGSVLDSLQFGSVGIGEGCGVMREGAIRLQDTQSIEQILGDINSQNQQMFTGSVPNAYKPLVKKINGHSVIEYTASGFCDTPSMYVPTQGRTYVIDLTCHGASSGAYLELETIAKTIQFTQ